MKKLKKSKRKPIVRLKQPKMSQDTRQGSMGDYTHGYCWGQLPSKLGGSGCLDRR